MKKNKNEMIWKQYEVARPFTLTSVYEALAHLCTLSPRGFIAFEIRAQNGEINYLIGVSPSYSGRIEEALRAHGDIEFVPGAESLREPVTKARYLTITKPILSLNADVTAAVIRQGLSAMSATEKEDIGSIQVVLGRGYSPSAVPQKLQDPNESWLDLALSGVRKATPDSIKSAKEKAEQFNFQTIIRIGASGRNADGRLDDMVAAFRVLESAGVRIRARQEKSERLNQVYLPWQINLRMAVKEIAPFLLLPTGEDNYPGVAGVHPRRLLPPVWYKEPKAGRNKRSFAKTIGGKELELSISPKDSLEHTILLGPTGSGKSTAMEHLILADIKAGRSVLVLDPKADLVTDILERIPKERRGDVVVIDPADGAPVGFNPLHFKGYQNKELIADAVLSVLHEIFNDSWGIRTQQILSATLLTLINIPHSTLLWLPTLLTNSEFRERIVAKVTDRIGLLPFWKQFEAMKESERNTNIGPVLNKLEQFIFRPGLRAILGQSKPKFDLMDLFYKRKIVLVPLNKGLVGGESAKLLGSLIVGLTWTLALKRAEIPAEKRHVVSIFIDELQDYLRLPTDLADALAQARGLGVGMTLAHQYRGQLPPEIRSAVDANARNKIIFGLNGTDAREMAFFAPELDAEDYMLLPRYQIYTNIMQNKRATGWIRAVTLTPDKPINLAAEVKAESMKRYGKDAKETDEEFLKLIEPETDDIGGEDQVMKDEAVGRTKR